MCRVLEPTNDHTYFFTWLLRLWAGHVCGLLDVYDENINLILVEGVADGSGASVNVKDVDFTSG